MKIVRKETEEAIKEGRNFSKEFVSRVECKSTRLKRLYKYKILKSLIKTLEYNTTLYNPRSILLRLFTYFIVTGIPFAPQRHIDEG